jgi:tetratricopeptide (TPR) repeat protein
MKLKLLFFVFSQFFVLNLFSQSQVLFDRIENQTFLIRYDQGGNAYKNQIINKLAQAYNKPLNTVSLTFSYKLSRQILRKNSQLEFIVNMSEISILGDNLYKGFEVGDALIPSKLSFKMQWLSGRNVINTYTFNDISVSGNFIPLVNMTVSETIPEEDYSINLIDIAFNYTFQNVQQFDVLVNLVDDYYDEDLIARNKIRQLNAMNMSEEYLSNLQDLNQLYALRDEANEYIKYTVDAKQKNFYKSLPIDTYDPNGFKEKLNQILIKSENLRDICNDIINNFDRIYYERGLDMLAQRKPDRADYFFNKSLEINPRYAPSHFQLARLYYNSGYVDKAVNKIFEIRTMDPSTEIKLQTVELAKGIYNDFLLDAGEFNNNGQFDDAIAILNRAALICRDFPEVHCRQNMDIEFSRAINGKYLNILNDVDVQFRNNNLKEAERIIGIAIDYAEQNRQIILNNSETALRLSELYNKYINRGNQYNIQSKFNEAVNELDNAARICNSYNEINCTDDLNNAYFKARTGIYLSLLKQAEGIFRSGDNISAEQTIEQGIKYREKYELKQDKTEDRLFLDIKQSIYAVQIDEGRRYANAGDYKSALQKYDEAADTENKFGIRKNTSLNSYIADAAKKLVFQISENGKNKVKVNNLASARELYNEAKMLTEKYNLGSDQLIYKEMLNFKSLIFERECLNAQSAYDDYVAQVKDLIAAKNYSEADTKIEAAFTHAKNYLQCEIETGALRADKEYITPAVNYLNKKNQTDEFVKRRNYKSAIELYQDAETYYKIQNVNKYGISHTDLFNYIQKNYTDFIIYGVGFYNHNKEFDKALDLLRELSRRNVKNKDTKDMQVILGADMATYDYNQNPNANINTNLATYTTGDKFFKYFTKSYKSQWKRFK